MKGKIKYFILLHLIILLYSLSAICSKAAGTKPFMSMEFILYYGAVIILLGIYAICWQQIIKKLPLTTAFSNKAVTVVWGILFGIIFFAEKISIGKIVGAILVIVGVVLYSLADKDDSLNSSSLDNDIDNQ